jgi:hypothetical protein
MLLLCVCHWLEQRKLRKRQRYADSAGGVVCRKMIWFYFYNEARRYVEASIIINAEIVDLLLMKMFLCTARAKFGYGNNQG